MIGDGGLENKMWLYQHKVVVFADHNGLEAEVRDWYSVPCIDERCTNRKRPNSCPFLHLEESSRFEFQIMDGTIQEANSCVDGFKEGIRLVKEQKRERN